MRRRFTFIKYVVRHQMMRISGFTFKESRKVPKYCRVHTKLIGHDVHVIFVSNYLAHRVRVVATGSQN